MPELELRHNPYTDKSIVLKDGKLYTASTLSKYLNQPFSMWVDKIMACCSQEVCDAYSFTYVGLPFYGRLLKYYADTNADCTAFKQKLPPLSDNCYSRLNKLNLLYNSGLQIKRINEFVAIYTDLEKTKVEDLFGSKLKLPFYKLHLNVLPFSTLSEIAQNSIPCFVLTEKEIPIPHCATEVYYIRISDRNSFIRTENSVYYETSTPDSLKDIISGYFEMGFLIPLIRKVLSSIIIDHKSPSYKTIITLDKTEPEIMIDVPQSVETGKTEKIKCMTLPPNSKSLSVGFSSLNNSILRIQNDFMEGVGVGETFVEAMSGQRLLGRFPVRVYQRNRASFMEFSKEEVALDVGDKIELSLNFKPSNADNISLVRIETASNCVRLLRNSENSITVEAHNPGKTKVTAVLDDLKASCFVRVFEKLNSLSISLDSMAFEVGAVSHIEVNAVPSAAILGELEYAVSPSHIAQFHPKIKALIGKTRGVGKLTVTDTRSDLKQNVEFRVI